jgi:hypothetical protein
MNFRPYHNTGIKILANKKQYLSQVSNSCYSYIPFCFCHSQVCEEQKEIKLIVIIFHKNYKLISKAVGLCNSLRTNDSPIKTKNKSFYVEILKVFDTY